MTSIALPCRVALVALALLAPVAAPMPAHAQSAQGAGTPTDPYQDLYAAMDAVLGSDQEFNKLYRVAMRQMRQVPENRAMEQRRPGILEAMGNAMKPWIKLQTDRVEARLRPRYIALMKDELTPEDARKLAAYFRTARGRKFLTDLYAEAAPEAPRPTQRLGQTTDFLMPATGHNPQSVAPPPIGGGKMTASDVPDPAVMAVLNDPELQLRATSFIIRMDEIGEDMEDFELDRDIEAGIARALDDAVTRFGLRWVETN